MMMIRLIHRDCGLREDVFDLRYELGVNSVVEVELVLVVLRMLNS
jgi:hypothetical protein